MADDVGERDDHDDRVEHQVDTHENHGDVDRLGESLQEHRAQQCQQDKSDQHLVSTEDTTDVRVLDRVRARIRRGQRHRDEEVGRREAQQHEDEELALPERQQPFQHRDRALAARALLRHPAVDRQCTGECDRHEHERRQRREHPGRERRDAGLVAQGGEVVDTGQAHDLPPPAPPVWRRHRMRTRLPRGPAVGACEQPPAHGPPNRTAPGRSAFAGRALRRQH